MRWISLSLAAMLLVVACRTSQGAALQGESWCLLQLPGPPSEFPDLPDAFVTPVKLDRMETAKEQLRNQSLKALSEPQATALAGSIPGSSEGEFYLVRSGIYARPGASLADYHHQAVIASRRFVTWRERDHLLLVLTLQLWEGEREIFPVPLVVRTKVKAEEAAAICQSLH